MLHDTRFIELPFTIFQIGAFIMLLFTFCDADFHFTPCVLPVQRQCHDGITFAIDATIQRVQLALVQQQFTRTRWVADVVR